MLHKVEHSIYPIDIYIHIGENIHKSLNQFITTDSRLMVDDNWGDAEAKVFRGIYHKDTEMHSIIIAFQEVPTYSLIAHELIHAIHRIYEHIGQVNYGDENNAYLMEYLTIEVEKAIKKFNDLKTK